MDDGKESRRERGRGEQSGQTLQLCGPEQGLCVCVCVGGAAVESEWTLGHSPSLLPNMKLHTLVLILGTF